MIKSEKTRMEALKKTKNFRARIHLFPSPNMTDYLIFAYPLFLGNYQANFSLFPSCYLKLVMLLGGKRAWGWGGTEGVLHNQNKNKNISS
jgi:hypothetical protein